jgi:hypothetical protein
MAESNWRDRRTLSWIDYYEHVYLQIGRVHRPRPKGDGESSRKDQTNTDIGYKTFNVMLVLYVRGTKEFAKKEHAREHRASSVGEHLKALHTHHRSFRHPNQGPASLRSQLSVPVWNVESESGELTGSVTR